MSLGGMCKIDNKKRKGEQLLRKTVAHCCKTGATCLSQDGQRSKEGKSSWNSPLPRQVISIVFRRIFVKITVTKKKRDLVCPSGDRSESGSFQKEWEAVIWQAKQQKT